MTEDEMVGWYDRLKGHEFQQALGDGEGQGNLVQSRGFTESDTTERLNNKYCSYTGPFADPWT